MTYGQIKKHAPDLRRLTRWFGTVEYFPFSDLADRIGTRFLTRAVVLAEGTKECRYCFPAGRCSRRANRRKSRCWKEQTRRRHQCRGDGKM